MPERVANAGLHRLKNETLDLHHEAERHVRILDDDATEATYVRFLTRMFGFHSAMEHVLAGHAALSAAGFDAASRRKQRLLRADLERLGCDVSAIPLCADLPDIRAIARAVGAAYVLEGSTLGGPFILSRMRVRLGYLVGSASAFLEGYGDATGPMWRRFTDIVEGVIVDAETGDAAVDAARATFITLITWLDERDAEPPHPFVRPSESRLVRAGTHS